MNRLNYAHSADELVKLYESATSERGYVPFSFSAVPAGVDCQGDRLTMVQWSWQLPAFDDEPMRTANDWRWDA